MSLSGARINRSHGRSDSGKTLLEWSLEDGTVTMEALMLMMSECSTIEQFPSPMARSSSAKLAASTSPHRVRCRTLNCRTPTYYRSWGGLCPNDPDSVIDISEL